MRIETNAEVLRAKIKSMFLKTYKDYAGIEDIVK